MEPAVFGLVPAVQEHQECRPSRPRRESAADDRANEGPCC